MIESVQVFGRSAHHVGVLARAESTHPGRPVVVFVNAGLIHRVGPNRLHVECARALAASGYSSFRFDLSNTGDATPRTDSLPFEAAAVEETRAAIDLALAETGAASAVLFGLCSGAMVSVKVALADPRIAAAVLINTQSYRVDGDLKRILDGKKESTYFWKVSFFNPASWKRLLTGRSNYLANLKMLVRQAAGIVSKKEAAAVEGWDLAVDFRALAARRFPALLVFSENDPALAAYRAVAKASNPESMGSFRLEVAAGADHTFTPTDVRRRLVDNVVRFVGSTFPVPAPRPEREAGVL